MLRIFRLALIIGILSIPALAHHSFAAEYDGKKPLTVKGTVTKIDWRNPHAYILLDVKDESGAVIKMTVEGHPPNTLRRTGWVNGVIKEQDNISVSGWAARDGSTRMAGREITLPNGKKLFWGPPSE